MKEKGKEKKKKRDSFLCLFDRIENLSWKDNTIINANPTIILISLDGDANRINWEKEKYYLLFSFLVEFLFINDKNKI